MAYTFTIAATSVTIQSGSLAIADVANGRATLTADILALSGSYRPAVGAEAILLDGATTLFGGYLTTVRETAATAAVGKAYRLMRIDAEDYNGIPARRYVTEEIASGTLKAALTTLVTNYLSAYGVALHASQVNGPTLGAISWTAVNGIDALNQLSAMSGGYLWRIDANKKLRMQVPGTDAAPFDITETTDDGDIVVESTKRDYANRIVIIAGTAGVVEKTDTFTGNGTLDTFTLTYPVTGAILGIVDRYDGATHYYETVDYAGGGGATWEVDYATNELQRVAGAPANGHTCTYRYLAQFPIVVTVEDAADIAANGVYERAIELPDVYDRDQAEAIANGYLTRGLSTIQTVTYHTYQSGLACGQLQHITAVNRNVDADGVIAEIRTTNPGLTRLRRTVVVTIGDQFAGSFRDVYTAWLGGNAQSVTVAASGGAAGTGTAVATGISATASGSEPASPAVGDVDLYTNAMILGRYDGSGWQPYGPLVRMTTPPTSGWSWLNQGSSAVSATLGGQLITLAEPTTGVCGRIRAVPSHPYTITVYLDGSRLQENWASWGVFWYDSGTGKLVVVDNGPAALPPGLNHLRIYKLTTVSTGYAAYREIPLMGAQHWIRIADNSTNRIVSISHNGQTWSEVHSVSRTDHLTANNVGFGGTDDNAAGTAYNLVSHLLSWEVA